MIQMAFFKLGDKKKICKQNTVRIERRHTDLCIFGNVLAVTSRREQRRRIMFNRF